MNGRPDGRKIMAYPITMPDMTKTLIIASVAVLAGVYLEKSQGISKHLAKIPLIGGLFA